MPRHLLPEAGRVYPAWAEAAFPIIGVPEGSDLDFEIIDVSLGLGLNDGDLALISAIGGASVSTSDVLDLLLVYFDTLGAE